MKILITTQHGEVAGATYSIFYLANGLRKKGHEIILLLKFGTLLHQLAVQHGITCIHHKFKNKLSFTSWFRFHRICEINMVDLVFAQESIDRYVAIFSKLIFGGNYKLALARRQKVKDNNIFKKFLYTRLSDTQVVISNGLKKEMIQLGFDSKKMKVIFNGMPLIDFTENEILTEGLKKDYNINLGDIIIGAVARPKRQEDLFAAMNYLPNNFKLLLIGITNQQLKEFFNDVDFSSIRERIILAGIIKENNLLYHHYKLMHVHTLCSDMDGFGMVTLEAMHLDIPVIGSDYGGIPDVIEHNRSGFIYQLGDSQELSRCILRIISEPDLRGRFKEEGRKRAKLFHIDGTVENYESYFSKLINA